jgi:hypothetical protein
MREKDTATAQVEVGNESHLLRNDRLRTLAFRVLKSPKTSAFKTTITGRTRLTKIGHRGEIALTGACKIARRHAVGFASSQAPTQQRRRQASVKEVANIWDARESPKLKPSARDAYVPGEPQRS